VQHFLVVVTLSDSSASSPPALSSSAVSMLTHRASTSRDYWPVTTDRRLSTTARQPVQSTATTRNSRSRLVLHAPPVLHTRTLLSPTRIVLYNAEHSHSRLYMYGTFVSMLKPKELNISRS